VKTDVELRHLRVFVAVVETGSHTRAARTLGVSQSTVSETLSGLERALGVPLFRRAGRHLALAPAGEVLLPHATRMLAQASELVGAVAKASQAVKATLVVSTVESVSAYVLPSRLAALRERWPKVQVEVLTGGCDDIRDRVAAGRSELGLVLESARASAGDDSVLATGELVIVGASAHPLGHRAERPSRPVAPEQLMRFEFFMCDAGGSYHHVLRRYFEAAGLPPPRTQALGTIEGVKAGVARAPEALGLLPRHAVERELSDGTLAELAMAPELPGLVLRAVYPAAGAVSPVVADLVRSLRGQSSQGFRLTA
jgi:DNA-binding transcriptional LysR family regulator